MPRLCDLFRSLARSLVIPAGYVGATCGVSAGQGLSVVPIPSEPHQMTAEEAACAIDAARLDLLAHPELPYAEGHVLVRFRPDLPAHVQADIERRLGCRLVRTLGDDGTRHLLADGCAQATSDLLSLLPFVEFSEPDYVLRPVRTPNDPLLNRMWGMENTGLSVNGRRGIVDADIDADEAWEVRTGDGSSIIAVLDDGVNWLHRDLRNNIWTNEDEIPGNGIDDDQNGYVDDVRGWDFVQNDNNPYQSGENHGTHVAGTIAAEGNNGVGVAGVLWNAQIMPLRFIGPNGGFASDAVRALNYAVANGARVSNNSWGGSGFSSALSAAVARAGRAGHIVVAAAGNGGENADIKPTFPAAFTHANVISVAAVDNADRLANFSNFGRHSVDIAAPGVNIASTYGNGYAFASGTSMSTPHVTGVIAALMEAWPEWSVAEVRRQLLRSARPVRWLNGRIAAGGVLNFASAMEGAESQDGEIEREPVDLGDEPTESAGDNADKDTPPAASSGPEAPSDLAFTARSSQLLVLSWNDNSSDETGFEVERESLRDGDWGNGFVLRRTRADVDDVAVEQHFVFSYRFRVRAVSDDGRSSWSGWAVLPARE